MNSTGFVKPALPLIVFTDLDGTLLDHDSYDFTPAVPALQRLAELHIPVIPVTSKTHAELQVLQQALALKGPCITENGGLIVTPAGYFDATNDAPDLFEYLSPDYATIRADLDGLRQRCHFNFEGFGDMSDARAAELTGLPVDDARLARQRQCSEPLVWRDSNARLTEFTRELTRLGYNLVKGGRFHHVTGRTDKARAIKQLKLHYQQAGFDNFVSLALGDSPNDRLMLQSADIAVAVKRKDGTWLKLDDDIDMIRTSGTGPEGWNEAVQACLDKSVAQNATEGTQHG